MDGKEKYYTCNTRWMGKKSIIHVTLDGKRKVLYM